MMRLYSYFRSSASYRVRIALAHKNIPYELVPVSLLEDAQRSAEHLARNPLGQVPVLEVESEGTRVHLAQSVAIIEYLEEVQPEPALLPKSPLLRARARELAEMVNAGIQPLQNTSVVKHVAEQLKGDRDAWTRHFMTVGLTALEARARETSGRFLVGDEPSIADVFLVPQLFAARRFQVSLEPFPLLSAIDARARELPRWELAHPDRQPDRLPTP